MPRDQAGPHLPVGRGVVGLRALVALPAPAHRDGRGGRARGMAARSGLGRRLREAAGGARRQARPTRCCWRRGSSPIRARCGCASTRPTRRTSRCRRSARARWCWSRTSTSRTVESQFHEAVFTHASTSPNQQLIASLDVARRQMELEGYGLVMNAIAIALKIRAGGEQPSADLEVLPGARRRRDDPGGVPAVRLRRLPHARRRTGATSSRRCARTSSTSIRRA